MTKIFGLAGLGALGTIAVAAIHSRRAAARRQQEPVEIDEIDAFDFTDLDEPVVVAEEVVVVTEAGPNEIEIELIPADDAGPR